MIDYEIAGVSREKLRLYAKLFRSISGYTAGEPMDPIALLDRLPDLEGFEDVRYEVVSDDALPGNVPARCIQVEDGYLIQIKEGVYIGASERNVGGHRMHIMHEIMHPFLDKLGYKPIYTRGLSKNVPAFRRLEWAVMAIAGEVMMPYEYTENMTENEIMQVYGVSSAAAKQRLKYQKDGDVYD